MLIFSMILLVIVFLAFVVGVFADLSVTHESCVPKAKPVCYLKGGDLACEDCRKNQTCADCLPFDMPKVEDNA